MSFKLLQSLGNKINVSFFLNSEDVSYDRKLDIHEFFPATSAETFNEKLTK